MPSASFDTEALYSTEHGTVDWTEAERLHLTLGERQWTVDVDDVQALHDALQPLAAQVYRCNCDCRWQVRRGNERPIVLNTDEVLRLHSLLDGAAAMLELDALLADASISRAR